jgi:hypothetical protein
MSISTTETLLTLFSGSRLIESRKQSLGQIAQSVEQRTENPCVGGSIPPLATSSKKVINKALF